MTCVQDCQREAELEKRIAELEEALREIVEMEVELASIIRDCQDILAAHLPPDGPSAKDTISMLLEILDGPRTRAVLPNN